MKPTSTRSSRRIFSPQFKAKVALDAISGELILAQLSQKYEVQVSQITSWKRLLLENTSDIFESSKGVEQVNLAHLYAKIGQQALELNFLNSALTKAVLRQHAKISTITLVGTTTREGTLVLMTGSHREKFGKIPCY